MKNTLSMCERALIIYIIHNVTLKCYYILDVYKREKIYMW